MGDAEVGDGLGALEVCVAGHHRLGLGFGDVRDLRVGKLIEIEVDVSTPAIARERVDEMCRKLLANTILEDYTIEAVASPSGVTHVTFSRRVG